MKKWSHNWAQRIRVCCVKACTSKKLCCIESDFPFAIVGLRHQLGWNCRYRYEMSNLLIVFCSVLDVCSCLRVSCVWLTWNSVELCWLLPRLRCADFCRGCLLQATSRRSFNTAAQNWRRFLNLSCVALLLNFLCSQFLSTLCWLVNTCLFCY